MNRPRTTPIRSVQASPLPPQVRSQHDPGEDRQKHGRPHQKDRVEELRTDDGSHLFTVVEGNSQAPLEQVEKVLQVLDIKGLIETPRAPEGVDLLRRQPAADVDRGGIAGDEPEEEPHQRQDHEKGQQGLADPAQEGAPAHVEPPGKGHATRWPAPASFRGGLSSRQEGRATGHRDRKRHPSGRAIRSGGSPGTGKEACLL